MQGDQLWFYYTGGMNYGLVLNRGVDSDAFAICLAILRRDGFISLDAGEEEGVLLTEPFTMPGGAIFVNADAFKGEISAEVLDKEGRVVAMSAPMEGDQLRGKLQWRKGNMADLKGEVVSILFKLRNAAFYSYWFAEKARLNGPVDNGTGRALE